MFQFIKYQVKLALTALMFYTRIPVPRNIGYSEELLNKSVKYFPYIGWIVGFVCGLTFYLSYLVFPQNVAVIVSMIFSVLLTGAFHEDGLADVCDGFGGGWGKEQILDIMKDSRIGTYGTIGLVLAFMLKFFSINAFSSILIPIALLSAHSLSRLMATGVIRFSNYARDDEKSKVKPIAKKISNFDFLIACIGGVLPLILFKNMWIFVIIVPMLTVTWLMAQYFKKHINGYTGDCLGAIQQVNELVFYLGLWTVLKYI